MGAAIVPIITMAAAAYGAYGQRQAGKFTQEVAKQNASLAEKAAVDAEARGRVEEGRHRQRVQAAIGSSHAQAGASGVVAESGSALDALADIAYIGESDALTIRRNAALEAWGLKTQAANILGEGALARKSANYGATATLLQGAASAAGSYYGAKDGWYLGKKTGPG